MVRTIPHSALWIHALNICIGCLCAAILGLTAYSVSTKDTAEIYLPDNTKSTGMSMLFWPGVGGIVDALLFAFVWNFRPNNTYYKAYVLFVASFIFVRPFIALVFTFAEWSGAAKSRTDAYSTYVTVETWACDVSQGSDKPESTGLLCTNLRAARYLQIPVLVLSIVFLGLVIRRIIYSRPSSTDTAMHTAQHNTKEAEIA